MMEPLIWMGFFQLTESTEYTEESAELFNLTFLFFALLRALPPLRLNAFNPDQTKYLNGHENYFSLSCNLFPPIPV